MTDPQDTPVEPDNYVTITPFGAVDALFDDTHGVTLQGPPDAVACVQRAIESSINALGMSMTVDNVEPADYFNFCQAPSTGILIIEPAAVSLLPPQPEEPFETEEQAALDSAQPNDPTNPEPSMTDTAAIKTAEDLALDDADDDGVIAPEDAFDPEEEFEATPGAEDGETPTMDGDFAGHPFRGNQHTKTSHESRGAVHASMRAKRAEQKGDHKGAKAAHRAAGHAHKAAAAFATGKAKAYHQIMAKFHGARSKGKAKMDSAVLDSAADLAALRAQLASAQGVMARLAAARAIQAARDAAAETADEDEGMTPEEKKQVAIAILQQLGGNKFKVMTGAKNAMAIGPESGAPFGGLQFSLPTGFSQIDGKSTGINRVLIRLNGEDTYDIEFGGARGTSYTVRSKAEGIYADSLREVFTRYTGLDTSLGSVTRSEPTREEILSAQEAAKALVSVDGVKNLCQSRGISVDVYLTIDYMGDKAVVGATLERNGVRAQLEWKTGSQSYALRTIGDRDGELDGNHITLSVLLDGFVKFTDAKEGGIVDIRAKDAQYLAAAFELLKERGWVDGPYEHGGGSVSRMFNGIGPKGTMVTPNGERRIIVMKKGSFLQATLGDETVASEMVPMGETAAADAAARINASVEAWAAAKAASSTPAEPSTPAIPDFASYAEAQAWMESRARAYGGKQKFYGSPEYRAAYPKIKALSDAEKSEDGAALLALMEEAGIKVGDDVERRLQSMMGLGGGGIARGKIVMRAGGPMVQMTSKQTVSRGGRLSESSIVPWEPAWRKAGTDTNPLLQRLDVERKAQEDARKAAELSRRAADDLEQQAYRDRTEASVRKAIAEEGHQAMVAESVRDGDLIMSHYDGERATFRAKIGDEGKTVYALTEQDYAAAQGGADWEGESVAYIGYRSGIEDSFTFKPAAATAEPSSDITTGPQFRYALVNRPAVLGTTPKGLQYTVEPRPAAGQPHHDMARHGILVTDRELTAEEVKAFELAPLVDGADLALLAEKIATGGMAEYANSYVEMARDEPDNFKHMVLESVQRASSGIRYSIGDPDLLVQMVLDKLKASIPAAIVTPDPGAIDPAAVNTTGDPTVTPPAADPARADALALLSMVAAGTHPDMLEPELADQIEGVLTRYPNDADIQAAGERAIVAYSNGLMAATG